MSIAPNMGVNGALHLSSEHGPLISRPCHAPAVPRRLMDPVHEWMGFWFLMSAERSSEHCCSPIEAFDNCDVVLYQKKFFKALTTQGTAGEASRLISVRLLYSSVP